MKNNTILSIAALVGLLILAAFFFAAQSGTSGAFPTSVAGLSAAQATQAVELSDGSRFALTVHEVKKTIAGSDVRMLAYNGSIPGPTLIVPEGVTVTVDFTNGTGMKTLLHAHGVRMENAFDGSQTVQKEMEPGETFSYKLNFPDAGTYWYHPHVREDYQQELGLYGAIIVKPASSAYWSTVSRELPLFLDDILIEGGKISPFFVARANHALMGRYGNVMLVNGDDRFILRVKSGETARLSFINAANARPFRVAIEGMRMKLVGADSGAYERETQVESVTLGPSERAIVEVSFDKPGSYAIENRTPAKTTKLGTIVVEAAGAADGAAPAADFFATLRSHLETIKSIDPFRASFAKKPEKTIRLSVAMGGMGGMEGEMGGMNGMMGDTAGMGTTDESAPHTHDEGTTGNHQAEGIEWENTMSPAEMGMGNMIPDTRMVSWKIVEDATRKENMDIAWTFKRGEKPIVRIENDPTSMHPMQHPIHFHGQRFLVLDRNGVTQENLVWKDTVLVPAGEYVDILLDASNPGLWMAHCHIPEHMESGMMMQFRVE